MKEAFIEAAEAPFCNFKNKSEIVASIKDVQLSQNTVTWQCERMAVDVEKQLKKNNASVSLLNLMSQLT